MWAASDHFRQSVAKLVTHSAKFWNFLDERRTTAKKNNVCQISPRPPNQCWSLFPALWSFRVWSTLCRGEGGKFYLGLGCSKIRQKRSSVSLLLKPIVAPKSHVFWFVFCFVSCRCVFAVKGNIWRIIETINYLWLRKYARIVVLGHYLFLEAHTCATVRFSEQIISSDNYPRKALPTCVVYTNTRKPWFQFGGSDIRLHELSLKPRSNGHERVWESMRVELSSTLITVWSRLRRTSLYSGQ